MRDKIKDLKNKNYRPSRALSSNVNTFENLFLLGNFLCIEQKIRQFRIEDFKTCLPTSISIRN